MLCRCGLSQTDAADYLDVQPRLVRRWINGERYPSGQPILPTPQHWAKLVVLRETIETAAAQGVQEIRRRRASTSPSRTHGRRPWHEDGPVSGLMSLWSAAS